MVIIVLTEQIYLSYLMISFADNLLWISWHDSAWIPILNPTNVMDYFQSNTYPF